MQICFKTVRVPSSSQSFSILMKGQKKSWEPRAERAQKQVGKAGGGVYPNHRFVPKNNWNDWSGYEDTTYRQVEECNLRERAIVTLVYPQPGYVKICSNRKSRRNRYRVLYSFYVYRRFNLELRIGPFLTVMLVGVQTFSHR